MSRDFSLREGRRHVTHADVAELLRHEQIRLAYEYLPAAQLVAVINAAVFAAVQSLAVDLSALVGWFSAVCAVAVVRMAAWAAFQRAPALPERMARWRAMAIAGAAASGFVWGAAAILLFPPTDMAHQVFVAFMLGGMVAGSVTTLVPVFPAFVAFAVLALAPVAIRFAIQQDAVHYAMGWMVVVFLVAVIVIARRSQHGLSDLLRLRAENAMLSAELLAAQGKLRQADEALKGQSPR